MKLTKSWKTRLFQLSYERVGLLLGCGWVTIPLQLLFRSGCPGTSTAFLLPGAVQAAQGHLWALLSLGGGATSGPEAAEPLAPSTPRGLGAPLSLCHLKTPAHVLPAGRACVSPFIVPAPSWLWIHPFSPKAHLKLLTMTRNSLQRVHGFPRAEFPNKVRFTGTRAGLGHIFLGTQFSPL